MKTILFLILEQYADWEAAYLSSALAMLGNGNYQVKTVSLSKQPVYSIGGFCTLPDYDINSAPKDYEALILIGGMTWRQENARQVESLVQDCYQAGKVLGGICDASAFLGTVGVLNNVKHTNNQLDDLKQWAKAAYTGETHYLAQQVVRDHNIITANGTAALEFAKEVLFALQAASEEKIMGWYNFHKLGLHGAPMPEM